MKITSIEAAGFRGIRGSVTVPVTDGFLIVNGSNGSGKSTLFDAIEFALTGRISRPALASENREDISSYIWWRGSGQAPERRVRVVFSMAGGETLTISRRPDGATFSVSRPGGEEQRFEEATLQRFFASESAPQEGFLTRLCMTTIIRDEQITELSVDAPEASRFSLVSDTLGSTQLPQIEERLKEAKQVLDGRVRRLEASYESARAAVNRLVAHVSEARSELGAEPDSEQARGNLAAALNLPDTSGLDVLMRHARNWLRQLRHRISVLSTCVPRLQAIERRREEIETEAYRAQLAALEQAASEAAEGETVASEQRALAEREADQFEARQPQMRSLGELLEHGRRVGRDDGRCPLCGSEISEDSFEAHLVEIADRLRREAGGLSESLERRETALASETAAEARRRQADQSLRAHRRRSEDLRVEFEEVDRELGALEGFAAPEAITSVAAEEALIDARSKLVPVEAAVAGVEASTSYARVVEQERALAQAREELAALEKSLEAARRASAHHDQANRMARRLAGELVDERLSQLEPLLVELYDRLRPHVQWSTVGYRVRGDVKRFMRLTVGDDELNPRFMFSSGQRRALGLAFLLSVHLSTTWSRWKTLVLDDPMQHVDDYRALHLAEVLSSIRRSGRQVLCAVEDRALADLLARRLATSGVEEGSLVRLKYALGDGSMVAGVERLPPLAPRLLTAA